MILRLRYLYLKIFYKVRVFYRKPTNIILVLALVAVAAFAFLYQRSQSEIKRLSDPRQVAKVEVQKLVEEVGKLVDLPKGEDPTVATVTDPEKLKNQPFFDKAKKGDKILIYTQAKRAFLYDPKNKKILEIAPINIGEQADLTAPVSVVLRNGTTTSSLFSKLESEVKKVLTNAKIVRRENASRKDYQNTIVSIIDPKSRGRGEQLARSLGAKVSDLPQGEYRPQANLLVIIGKDKE